VPLEQQWKDTMHPYDRANPPSGAGWVIQIVGHHYNPSPRVRKEDLSKRELAFAKGPAAYIQQIILPSLMRPYLRINAGIHHPAMTWFNPDKDWTTDKGLAGVLPAPMLAKDQPKASESDSASGDMGKMMAAMGNSGGMMGGMGKGKDAGAGGMMGMAGMMGNMGMMGTPKAKPGDVKSLTRTDFKIEFVWQPPKPEDLPKDEAEAKTKVEELVKKMDEEEAKQKGSIKPLDEDALASLSKKRTEEAIKKIETDIEAMNKAAAPAANGAPAGGNTPAGEDQAPAGNNAAPPAGAAPK
jgi:type IV pilus assembly protein PilM